MRISLSPKRPSVKPGRAGTLRAASGLKLVTPPPPNPPREDRDPTRVESLAEFRARMRGLVTPKTVYDLSAKGMLDLFTINGITHVEYPIGKGARQ